MVRFIIILEILILRLGYRKAILWYERGKKIIPFDPDLKFNLKYAENFVKDIKSDSNIHISDILFFWNNMISSRILQYFALISF